MSGIYCIEGDWDFGYEWGEPSVEPLLQMIQGISGCRYIRRNSATFSEMRYWVRTELCSEVCNDCSILYIASHGSAGNVSLSNREEFDEVESIHSLPKMFGHDFAVNRLIHFGGCKVLKYQSKKRIGEFLESSGASAVSGFKSDAGWASAKRTDIPPSLALELMFFSSICEDQVNLGHHRSVQAHLPPLAAALRRRFRDCGFCLHTRWDAD